MFVLSQTFPPQVVAMALLCYLVTGESFMKRLSAFLCSFALMAAFAVPAVAADSIVVKIAGSKPDGNPQTIGMRYFAKRLGELSNGKYKVQVFPHNQLGKEDNYLTQTRNGTIGKTVGSRQPVKGGV